MRRYASRLLLIGCCAVLAAGQEPQPVATYKSDATRSSLQFSFRQAGAVNQGAFKQFTVVLRFAPNRLAASSLAVNVDIASLDTRDPQRDDMLRGAELFAVATHPQASFESTRLLRRKDGRYEALGKLRIRGVARELRLPLAISTVRRAGLTFVNLTGSTVIRRLDFGVGQGDWKSTEWVDNEVTIRFDVLLTAVTPSAAGR